MGRLAAALAVVVVSASVSACGNSGESTLEKAMHSSAKSFSHALSRQKRLAQELKGKGCGQGGAWENESRAELAQEAKEFKPGAVCHLRRYEETASQLRGMLKER